MTATSTLTLSAFLLARYDEEDVAVQWWMDHVPNQAITPPFTDTASLRAVVELHAGLAADDQEYSGWQQLGQQTLLALAQPFRDHHDMRAEWVTG